MQPETQYYKSVKASEPPKVNRWYNAINGISKVPCVIFFKNDSWYDEDGFSLDKVRVEEYEYLEPIQLPDAAVLRDKMQEIADLLWDKPNQSAVDEAATIAREALSQTGDGWVRVEDGLPDVGRWVQLCEDGDPVLNFFKYVPRGASGNPHDYFEPKHGKTIWNVTEATHWRYVDLTPPKP